MSSKLETRAAHTKVKNKIFDFMDQTHSRNLELSKLQKKVHACEFCPRLRSHCTKIAQIKKRAYRSETYWGKPVSGFGDPGAQFIIIGLAPAAHGANRTGRIFTGDRSGDWLFRALYKAGFSNQPTSKYLQDSLTLQNTYVTCIVKCAPPDNMPTPEETKNCENFIAQEVQYFNNAKIWLALGQIAYKQIWPLINTSKKKRPPFKHGEKIDLENNQWLFLSYHPSQQNTFTGRLTEATFDPIFSEIKKYLSL